MITYHQTATIKRSVQNQYKSDGLINAKSVIFLVDTGATDVVIPGKMAQALNLIQGEECIASTIFGDFIVYETHIKELTIGNIILHNVSAVISPQKSGDEILLGMSALGRLALSFKGDSLILSYDSPVYLPSQGDKSKKTSLPTFEKGGQFENKEKLKK